MKIYIALVIVIIALAGSNVYFYIEYNQAQQVINKKDCNNKLKERTQFDVKVDDKNGKDVNTLMGY